LSIFFSVKFLIELYNSTYKHEAHLVAVFEEQSSLNTKRIENCELLEVSSRYLIYTIFQAQMSGRHQSRVIPSPPGLEHKQNF